MVTITTNNLDLDLDYQNHTDATPLGQKGGQLRIERPSYKTIPPPKTATTSSLAMGTMKRIRDNFEKIDHRPSEEMWVALTAIVQVLEAMAIGDCPSSIYVSSLDPGIGKTTTIIQFIKELLSSSGYDDVGVLVCVQRRDQIADIVEEADLDQRDFAVLTSDGELNALGCATPTSARVLFTTHSMIERRCEGRSIGEVAAFHYRGNLRQVRIWDEAILPGRTLTLSRDSLALLLAPLRVRFPSLARDIESLFERLKEAEDGSTIYLENLAQKHGVEINQALSLVAENAQQELAVQALWFLFGRHVSVRHDGMLGATMLDYEDTLPHDIQPILVLDASARVRTTYEFWDNGRGGVTRLPSATKRYGNLNIHVWDRGGGKSSFRKNGDVLLEGVVSTILTKPDQDWLIVHHKGIDMDFEAEVRALLPIGVRVHFLNWGAHDATNSFGHVPNIILAGTLFYPTSYLEALGRLAGAFPPSTGAFPDDALKAVTLGEHRHLILQAVCRGAVRKCDGDGCPPTSAYLIASTRSGIRRELPGIFPGAKIHKWQPVKRALRGKVAEAVSFIEAALEASPSSLVSFGEVRAHLGWKDRKSFNRSIRRHDDFIAALDELGIEEWGAGRHSTGFRFIPDELSVEA